MANLLSDDASSMQLPQVGANIHSLMALLGIQPSTIGTLPPGVDPLHDALAGMIVRARAQSIAQQQQQQMQAMGGVPGAAPPPRSNPMQAMGAAPSTGDPMAAMGAPQTPPTPAQEAASSQAVRLKAWMLQHGARGDRPDLLNELTGAPSNKGFLVGEDAIRKMYGIGN